MAPQIATQEKEFYPEHRNSRPWGASAATRAERDRAGSCSGAGMEVKGGGGLGGPAGPGVGRGGRTVLAEAGEGNEETSSCQPREALPVPARC